MDREISFRGKRLDNGEWVYGSLIQMDEGGSQSFIFPFYKYASSLACNQIVSMFMVAVDPTTVGQFTGRCDKNGVKIFEGDMFIDFGNRLMVVEFPIKSSGFHALVVSDKTLGYPLVYEDISRREIIGNIHDNPELVKKEESE